MQICLHCGHTEYEHNWPTNTYQEMVAERVRKETYAYCPICGSDDLADAVACEHCGEYVAADDTSYRINPETDEELRVCSNCADEFAEKEEAIE